MATNILPWTLPVNIETNATLPRAEEWAWDFDTYEFARDSKGNMYKVYEDDAIRIWIWKLLKTERWREVVHSEVYGSDVWSLLGKGFTRGFTEAEAKRIVREALETNLGRYIKEVGEIDVQLVKGVLKIKVPIRTIYSREERVMEFG